MLALKEPSGVAAIPIDNAADDIIDPSNQRTIVNAVPCVRHGNGGIRRQRRACSAPAIQVHGRRVAFSCEQFGDGVKDRTII